MSKPINIENKPKLENRPLTRQYLKELPKTQAPKIEKQEEELEAENIDEEVSDSSISDRSTSTERLNDSQILYEPIVAEPDNFEFMASSLTPKSFSGSTTDDVQLFINDVVAWLTVSRINDDACKVAAASLLLKGGAKIWFENLAEKPETLDQMTELLTERFASNNANWGATSKIWDAKQKCGESVDAFITKIEEAARRHQLTEPNIIQIIIKGLLPTIKTHVLNHEITDVNDLRKWAEVAETIQEISSEPAQAMAQSMIRLEEKLDKMQIREIKEETTFVPTRRIPNRYQTNSTSRYNNNRGGYRGNNYRPGNRCEFCGGPANHGRVNCPANGAVCHKCGKRSHFARVCKSALQHPRTYSNQ